MDVEEVLVKKSRKMSAMWTREVLTRFFEEFETFPCLFDTKSRFYSNKHARADALKKICISLDIPGLTVEDVKQKINNVRTQISHELKKVKSDRSGDGAEDKYEPIWWFDMAQFLFPHIKSRKAHDCLDCDDIQDSEQSMSITTDDSTSSTRENISTPTNKPTMMRKKKTNDDDAAYVSTLQTLEHLANSIATTTVKKDYKEHEFANFVMKELSDVDDMELVLEAKQEITNILFYTKKQWIERMKTTTYEIIE